jgi:hypothetical protein
MAEYDTDKLSAILGRMTERTSADIFATEVVPYLVDVWLEEYDRSTPSSNIVETSTHNPDSVARNADGTPTRQFSYLFDIENERLIAAWGISHGREAADRDHSRMAGHPLSDGHHYHRGHAIPHRLGGPTDINLVPQLGSVNVGAFRHLENEAVATPGALYFTYWVYGLPSSQRPESVDQGLLRPRSRPDIRRHTNLAFAL